MHLKDIINEIQKERSFDEYKSSSLNEQFLIEDGVLMGEILNPQDAFVYDGDKGWFYYKDSSENLFFVRLIYQPTQEPYFELKAGWFEDNDIRKPKYDPLLPPNVLAIDTNKRGNTVAKIYRDEIIPFFVNKQSLSNKLMIKPSSVGRYKFSIRMIRKFTPSELKVIENYSKLEILVEK
jgi:hypothetical protein